MKITINSTELARTLAAVSKTVASKSPVPVLDNFLLRGVGDDLYITGSDNQNWTTLAVRPALITYLDDGFDNAFCIEAKLLMQAVRELPSQPVGLEVSSDHSFATLRWMNGEAQIPITETEQYPMPVPVNKDDADKMPAVRMREIIDTVSFATGNDELRPVMNGIYFDNTNDTLVVCATNGYSLARLSVDTLKPLKNGFILPRRSADLLATFVNEVSRLAGHDDDIRLEVAVNGVNISFSSVTAEGVEHSLVCRMIEGKYPNYNSIIPKNPPYAMVVNRNDLMAALRRVRVFADPSALQVVFKISQDQLVVSATDANFSSSSEETVPCSFDGTDGFRISFRIPLLLEMLGHIPAEEVKIQLVDYARAGVFLPHEQTGDSRLLMLVMPMILEN